MSHAAIRRLASACAIIQFALAAHAAPTYHATDLGPAWLGASPAGMNAAGDVVGQSAQGTVLVLRHATGATTDFGTLGGTAAHPKGIDGHGVAIGYSDAASGAVSWRLGVDGHTLPMPPDFFGQIDSAPNTQGEFASTNSPYGPAWSYPLHGFRQQVSQADQASVVGTALNDVGDALVAVNPGGTIAGNAVGNDGVSHAFLFVPVAP